GPTGGVLGGFAGEAGGAMVEKFFNHLLFDPEFGQTFTDLANATKEYLDKGTAVPKSILAKMSRLVQNMKDKYAASPWSREEGSVALGGVTPRRAGHPTAPNLEHDIRGFEDARKESDEGR